MYIFQIRNLIEMEVKWRRVGMMPTTISMSTMPTTGETLKNLEEEPW